ncbi:MAG TPA: PAS domain-containing protein [Ferrovibrio sp.]|uniref:PAS domain-containing protein n=1 Tax=Ferrovibrio sp. TaxID=1917215 RepID=UPI002ED249CB
MSLLRPLPLLPAALAPAMPAAGTAPAAPGGFTAESEKFLAAWHGWRGPAPHTALLPRRAQVDLVSICRLMPQLAVLEVRGPDKAVFRLAGTEIESQFGAPLTGCNAVKLAPPEQQLQRGRRLWQMVQQPCAAVLRLTVEHLSGRHDDVEIAAAPVLPDEAGAPVQVFAVLSRLPRQRWGESDPITRNMTRNLRFLDIGAGLPAKI